MAAGAELLTRLIAPQRRGVRALDRTRGGCRRHERRAGRCAHGGGRCARSTNANAKSSIAASPTSPRISTSATAPRPRWRSDGLPVRGERRDSRQAGHGARQADGSEGRDAAPAHQRPRISVSTAASIRRSSTAWVSGRSRTHPRPDSFSGGGHRHGHRLHEPPRTANIQQTMKKEQHTTHRQGSTNSGRREAILNLFREFPNNKFSLKQLASVSGGASKEGRRETFEISDNSSTKGWSRSAPREIPPHAAAPAPLRGRGRHDHVGCNLRPRRGARRGYLRQPAQHGQRPSTATAWRWPSSTADGRPHGGRGYPHPLAQPQALCGHRRGRGPSDLRAGRFAPHADGHLPLSKRNYPRRPRRREGSSYASSTGSREQEPRGRAGRAAGTGRQQRHGDARHPGRIRTALPLRTRGRGRPPRRSMPGSRPGRSPRAATSATRRPSP